MVRSPGFGSIQRYLRDLGITKIGAAKRNISVSVAAENFRKVFSYLVVKFYTVAAADFRSRRPILAVPRSLRPIQTRFRYASVK